MDALAAGDLDAELDRSERLGRQALTAGDHEQAVTHFAHAQTLAVAPQVDAARQFDLLTALAEAHAHLGHQAAAREVLLEAIARAQSIDDHTRVVTAALALPHSFAGAGPRGGETDRTLLGVLRQAIARLDDPALRIRARARAVQTRAWVTSPQEVHAEADEVQQEARAVADPLALALALEAWQSVWQGPAHTLARLDAATEQVAAAEQAGDVALVVRGHTGRVTALLELGDLPAAATAITAVDRLARTTGLCLAEWLVHNWRAMRAQLAEDHETAERELIRAMTIAGEAGDADAIECGGVQLVNLRWRQGRMDEVKAMLDVGGQREPPLAAWRCAMADYLVDTGQPDAAARVVRELVATGVDQIPVDPSWMIAITSLARAAVAVGPPEVCRELYERLAPYADRMVVVGPAALCHSPIALVLGRLAARLGELGAARSHLKEAAALCETLGAPGLLAEARSRLAEVLAEDTGGPDAEAVALLEGAITDFEALGMARDVERAQAVREGWRTSAASGPGGGSAALASAGPAVVGPRRLRHTSTGWEVTFGDRTVQAGDSIGMRYLAALLAAPGADLLALDLLVGEGRTQTMPEGDLGPLLDPTAKAALRRRITELQTDLEDAEAARDTVRAERALVELQAIQDHLAGAVGLHGRDRQAGSPVERARLSVTKAIRYRIGRIATVHPELGHHLSTCVRTGTYCRYDPGPDASGWEVDTGS